MSLAQVEVEPFLEDGDRERVDEVSALTLGELQTTLFGRKPSVEAVEPLLVKPSLSQLRCGFSSLLPCLTRKGLGFGCSEKGWGALS